jgi:hypothetical protein
MRIERETREHTLAERTGDGLFEKGDVMSMLDRDVHRAVELATSQAFALCTVANWIQQ